VKKLIIWRDLKILNSEILNREEKFHDEWAEQINSDKLLVEECFEVSSCPKTAI